MKFFYGEVGYNKKDISEKEILLSYTKFYDNEYKKNIIKIDSDFVNYCELLDYKDSIIKFLYKGCYLFGDINFLRYKKCKIDKQIIKNRIIDLYKEYEFEFLKDIDGEFSMILIDTNIQTIHLIKDQIGTKPIYYYINKKRLVFASDLFLMDKFITRDIKSLNDEYFKEFYYCMGNINSENTPYKYIKRVENGSIISIDYNRGTIHKKIYWDISKTVRKINGNEESIIDNFKKIMTDSIQNRISEKKKIGVMMSGGLDSTSIYSIIKGILNKNATVVTGIYDELKLCDERNYSNQVINKYPDECVEVKCDDYGLFYGFPESYYFTYEPFVNSLSLKLTEELIKQASKSNVKILLDGYAADHILGGNLSAVINIFKKLKFNEVIKNIKENSLMTNKGFMESFYEYIVIPLLTKDIPGIDNKVNKFYKKKYKNINDFNKMELLIQLNSANAYIYTDRIIAPRYDIELKHPFLDKEIIEYIYCIDYKYRLNPRYNKYILRESMRNLLPDEVRTRISKTENVSLSYKGIVEYWNKLFPILSNFKIGKMDFIDLSKQEWLDQLYKYRSGQTVRNDFLVLLTLELWLNIFLNTLEYD